LLVISPLKGVLMKAGTSTLPILAIAAEVPAASQTYTYQDKDQTKTADVSRVKVNLDRHGHTGTLADSSLSRLGRALAGKEVGEARVIIAMIIFFIVLIAEGAILYGAISSAIGALGRNPLARKIIRAELFRVIVVAGLVLLVGLGAVYGVLKI